MRPHIKEQEADAMLRVQLANSDQFILHLEFQQGNDLRMVKRMASYDFMLHLKYNMDILGIVIYTGRSPLKLNNTVRFNNNFYRIARALLKRGIDISDVSRDAGLHESKLRKYLASQ